MAESRDRACSSVKEVRLPLSSRVPMGRDSGGGAPRGEQGSAQLYWVRVLHLGAYCGLLLREPILEFVPWP